MKRILWIAFVILINNLNSIIIKDIRKESTIKKMYGINNILLWIVCIALFALYFT